MPHKYSLVSGIVGRNLCTAKILTNKLIYKGGSMYFSQLLKLFIAFSRRRKSSEGDERLSGEKSPKSLPPGAIGLNHPTWRRSRGPSKFGRLVSEVFLCNGDIHSAETCNGIFALHGKVTKCKL